MGVGPIADDDDTSHDILTVFVEHAAAEFWSQVDIRDIANVDRRARAGGEDDVLNIRRRANQANSPDCHLLVAGFNDLRTNVRVATSNTLDDAAQGDVVGAQLNGINVDLILAYPTADARHFGHAGHRIQLVLDEPVLQGMQCSAVVGAFDRVPEDLAHAGCIRT